MQFNRYKFLKGKWFSWKTTGPRFNIKMSSYQYRKYHCGDKTAVRLSYLHNGIYFILNQGPGFFFFQSEVLQTRHVISALLLPIFVVDCLFTSCWQNCLVCLGDIFSLSFSWHDGLQKKRGVIARKKFVGNTKACWKWHIWMVWCKTALTPVH